ncbi:cytochrome P450 [Truncatella angustata]|uniref:Cytochrome P450 n=1 Tax=Truncatella angustata TaxID=152316 RepID=A0A9P8ZX42_9PEZI|nr:cytochrome P450 [Truncatella angustata]KAH6654422.1 cytochrome P450 [Truncatella angustata]
MALLNPYLLGAGLLLAILSYVWSSLTTPLRDVPGPISSLFTSWILKWHEFHANRTRYVHQLHESYGPVVRIAPNEVSFVSTEGVKEIYQSGGSGYDKTEFYNLFQVYGRRTMFSTLNKSDHAKRKRVLADRYANTNIMRSVSMDGIKERSGRFIDHCTASVGGSLDIFVTLHNYAFDCISHHLFHPYGSDALRKQQDEEIMKEVAFDDSLQNRLIKYYNPALYSLIGGILGVFAKPRETPGADHLVLSASSKTDPEPFTLVSRMQEKAHGMDHLDMAAECLDHMAAGIDTTGDALCFLMWEISQPRSIDVQKRLQQEIKMSQNLTSDKLTYLDAVVLEGLRCTPAIPMSLPRYVPKGGRTIDGYFVPERTIVSSQAYSAHRIDQKVFPEPDLFNPNRWLEQSGDAERKRLFFAFASGGRGCVGKHLALAEMKTLLVDVYSRFTTLPDPSMTQDMMEMSDQLISSQPLGKKCLIRFLPLEKNGKE